MLNTIVTSKIKENENEDFAAIFLPNTSHINR